MIHKGEFEDGDIGRNQGQNKDRKQGNFALSEALITGLYAVHRYRLMSVEQFARLAQLHREYARDQLRQLERRQYLGSIGNVGLRGGSKAPKLYYLTRSGYALLLENTGLSPENIGGHIRPHTSTKWSPIMAHRVGTVDLLVAAEVALAPSTRYRLAATFHEYRREKRGKAFFPETSDCIPSTGEVIVPDGALILENLETGKRGLFFLEYDRRTERITSTSPQAYSVVDKFSAYERYLKSGQFAHTYERYGAFSFATILFVTQTDANVQNIRQAATNRSLQPYFWLSTFTAAKADFFRHGWISRDPQNQQRKQFIQEK